MIARLLVKLWLFVGGRHKLPGVGTLMRLLSPIVPELRAFPFAIPHVGVARLDFRDASAYGMIKIFALHDLGPDACLFKTLERVLKPASVFWDIGANVGFVSAYFAHPRFQLQSIQAFEPNPQALKSLEPLFKDCPRVTVHPFGLGRDDSTLEMTYTSTLVGSVVLKNEGGRKIPIKIRNGDKARQELAIPLPDVIKIDVEGFEPEVFAGLSEIIRQARPVIIFEHLWLTDEVIGQLIPKDYALLFLWDDGVITRDYANRRNGHDAILVPNERIDLVSQLSSSGTAPKARE